MLHAPEPVRSHPPLEGASYRFQIQVQAEHTAQQFGGEYPPVLATPTLLGWMEVAAGRCLEGHLDEDVTSLGYKVELTHRLAAWPGQTVDVHMRLVRQLQSLLLFEGEALVDHQPIAEIRHQRKLFQMNGLRPGD